MAKARRNVRRFRNSPSQPLEPFTLGNRRSTRVGELRRLFAAGAYWSLVGRPVAGAGPVAARASRPARAARIAGQAARSSMGGEGAGERGGGSRRRAVLCRPAATGDAHWAAAPMRCARWAIIWVRDRLPCHRPRPSMPAMYHQPTPARAPVLSEPGQVRLPRPPTRRRASAAPLTNDLVKLRRKILARRFVSGYSQHRRPSSPRANAWHPQIPQ